MDIVEQKRAADQFVKDWLDRGDEKQDTQNYWNQLLRTVYGVGTPEQYIAYEKAVAKGFIDGYIADTRVLIEQNLLAMARGGITIEDDVQIAANVQLLSNNHDPYDRQVLICKPIHIKQGAWIGAGASIMAGVTIGRYAG